MELIETPLPSPRAISDRYHRLAQLPRSVEDQKVMTVYEARQLTHQLLAALEQVRIAELERRHVQVLCGPKRWRPDNEWLGIPTERLADHRMDDRFR